VSAIDTGELFTAQIHLLPKIAREDGVSHRFGWTRYSKYALTRYNSQRGWCQLSIRLDSLQHKFTYSLEQPEKIVSAIDSAKSFTAQIYLLPEIMVSAIDSALLVTAQIHLLPITARGDVSYRFSSTIYYSRDSLTNYNSQKRECQVSIQLGSVK
jgi:hypothetical protein